jgi:hypothetical protein
MTSGPRKDTLFRIRSSWGYFKARRLVSRLFSSVLVCFLDTAAFRCLWVVYRIEKDSLTDKQRAG